MFEYKVSLGILAILVGLISYVPYFRNIFSGKTKPHAFSWFVWSVLTGIAFAAQLVKRGGAGAWVTGFTALAGFVIFLLALYKGKKDFPLFDWLCLASAFIAAGLWWYTKDPTGSIILITVTDALAFLPTFRKGYYKPHEETATTFALSSIKFLIALFALETFTLVTALYPVSLVITNGLFVVLLCVRRKQLHF